MRPPKTHCSKCLAPCQPEEFAKERTICKKCNATRTWNGKQASRQAYRAKNREARRAYDIEWLAKHPDFWHKNWIARDPESREKALAINRAWLKANPEKNRKHSATYAQLIRQATPPWADKAAIRQIYANRPKGHDVDHIIPLIGVTPEGWMVSGLHVPLNLQYLTPAQNRRKRRYMARDPHLHAFP